LQDTLKEGREFLQRMSAILFRQPHHAVLDDIESRVFIPHGKQSLLEGAAFGAGEKVGKL
jgi:hypothetical protein